ncbi:hypothetical protein [Nocardioides okcheonensis]|uniref:hypothetical protein n=1 Tax=Nocardioides okcheonensis TaxID=2894081 RepID=UPI001E4CDAF9|nr:hypothetical protein [Nocardioides okcheonensis]UFN44320.1 hypothetical protein LN652_20105 [Nocardioides okcheonensis]
MGKKAKGKGSKDGKVAKLPKKKCCEDTPKCQRCPLRMLKEGTLPEGYTVHKRRLVTTAELERSRRKKSKKKIAA